MLRQMWKKRVCFVLAVILAVIAVTPMEMEHTDAAMVHSVTALMTGNLVNKSNADKLTYRQLETSAYERKLISKSVYNYTMQQVPALYEGRNVINVSGMTGKANQLGLTGWVKNLYDGSVEMEVEGEEPLIDQLIIFLQNRTYVWIENMDAKSIPLEHDNGFYER